MAQRFKYVLCLCVNLKLWRESTLIIIIITPTKKQRSTVHTFHFDSTLSQLLLKRGPAQSVHKLIKIKNERNETGGMRKASLFKKKRRKKPAPNQNQNGYRRFSHTLLFMSLMYTDFTH